MIDFQIGFSVVLDVAIFDVMSEIEITLLPTQI